MKAQRNNTPTVVSALTARTQLGQILERVNTKKERFLIGKRGQPQAIVMGISDYLDIVAPAPDWLQSMWESSKKNGTDKLTMREIDNIIADYRKEKKATKKRSA